MQLRIRRLTDQISPALRQRLRRAGAKPARLRAIGTQLVSLGKRAFSEPALRPEPWPARQGGGSHPLLRKSGTLSRSLRVIAVTAGSVVIGSDRKYAAIHQLGGVTKAHIIRPKKKKALAWPGGPGPRKAVKHPGSRIPARPFFPLTGRGRLSPLARQRVEAIISHGLGMGPPPAP